MIGVCFLKVIMALKNNDLWWNKFCVATCSCIIKGKSRPFTSTIFILITYPSALLYPSMVFSTFLPPTLQMCKISWLCGDISSLWSLWMYHLQTYTRLRAVPLQSVEFRLVFYFRLFCSISLLKWPSWGTHSLNLYPLSQCWWIFAYLKKKGFIKVNLRMQST